MRVYRVGPWSLFGVDGDGVPFHFSIGDILDVLVTFVDFGGQVSLDLEGEGAARDVDRDDGLGVVVHYSVSTQGGVVVVAVDEHVQSSGALRRHIISGMGEDVDGIGCVESEDLEDLSVDDAADLCGAGIHRVCIRPSTELATLDELGCCERSLSRSEEHVGRRE